MYGLYFARCDNEKGQPYNPSLLLELQNNANFDFKIGGWIHKRVGYNFENAKRKRDFGF